MFRPYLLFTIVFLIIGMSCKKKEIHQKNYKYLFLGHTYAGRSIIDSRVAPYLDRTKYDHFWMGGDMCAETTEDSSTLEYLDSLFDLGSPNTHWALGNHDIRNGNLQWITNKTERPTFYTATFNGICMLVLNTTFSQGGTYDTVAVNAQYDMIKNVCDTLQNVSHLILLSHHVCWIGMPDIDSAQAAANATGYWLKWRFNPEEHFANGIYPMLVDVKSRGINVINIAGDLGQESTDYYEKSADGIHFLGSGITSDIPWNNQFSTHGKEDKILIFEHDMETQKISWHFDVL
jgi:hypothetical protein